MTEPLIRNPMQCPVSDDNGIRCEVTMTRGEQRQDGMCSRCACHMSEYQRTIFSSKGHKFVFQNPKIREYEGRVIGHE